MGPIIQGPQINPPQITADGATQMTQMTQMTPMALGWLTTRRVSGTAISVAAACYLRI